MTTCHFPAVATVDRKDSAGLLVGARVALRSGDVVALHVVFNGEQATGLKEIIARERDYRDELAHTMRRARIAATSDGNKRKMEREIMSWFEGPAAGAMSSAHSSPGGLLVRYELAGLRTGPHWHMSPQGSRGSSYFNQARSLR